MSSISGIERLRRKLKNMGINSDVALKLSMKKNIKLVQAQAKMLCPVDSGDLRKSIDTGIRRIGKDIVGEVYTNNDHASYVEFGTGQRGAESNKNTDVKVSYKEDWAGMEAQPYLYPALHDKKDEVLLNITNDLRRAMKK